MQVVELVALTQAIFIIRLVILLNLIKTHLLEHLSPYFRENFKTRKPCHVTLS